jgi:hypothetical protein
MNGFEELLTALGCTFTKASSEGNMDIFQVQHDDRYFLALVFEDKGKPSFLRLMFVLDRIDVSGATCQYEMLLELNRETWMGSYAIDTKTGTVLYVFNFPMVGFDAQAMAIAEETFDMARRIYQEAAKE